MPTKEELIKLLSHKSREIACLKSDIEKLKTEKYHRIQNPDTHAQLVSLERHNSNLRDDVRFYETELENANTRLRRVEQNSRDRQSEITTLSSRIRELEAQLEARTDNSGDNAETPDVAPV